MKCWVAAISLFSFYATAMQTPTTDEEIVINLAKKKKLAPIIYESDGYDSHMDPSDDEGYQYINRRGFQCSICDYISRQKINCLRHINTMHRNNQIAYIKKWSPNGTFKSLPFVYSAMHYRCDPCNKIYYCKPYYERHIASPTHKRKLKKIKENSPAPSDAIVEYNTPTQQLQREAERADEFEPLPPPTSIDFDDDTKSFHFDDNAELFTFFTIAAASMPAQASNSSGVPDIGNCVTAKQ